jgi:hypothetical protein
MDQFEMTEKTPLIDTLQREIVRLVATSPAGHKLLLIGGFRYRFIDRSARLSMDIDYHWAGELEVKQRELVALFQKRLIPTLNRQFGVSGSADAATGIEADSPSVRVVKVAVWREGEAYSRIEIPVEITRICHTDDAEVRTVAGVVYPTLSDVDLLEGKILAVFNRSTLAHRDLVDIFLFNEKRDADSPVRLAKKIQVLKISRAVAKEKVDDLILHSAYHAKAVQAVIDTQLDLEAAKNINASGGGEMVLKTAVETIRGMMGAE